jgi:hypothetical protein
MKTLSLCIFSRNGRFNLIVVVVVVNRHRLWLQKADADAAEQQ